MQAIPFVNLPLQHRAILEEILSAVEGVIASGHFILGDALASFEEEFAKYCGTRYAVGVANGTDALTLSLKSLGIGPGDEVITVPNSFLASAACIAMAGATPVFVDVREDFNMDPRLLDSAITSRTKAVIPVHLTGRPADMQPVMEMAQRHGLAVIEDAAQAVGAMYRGQSVGSFGAAGCFSFHPLKNLSACGDGGLITTNDERMYRYLLKARNHGLKSRDECAFFSGNSRLDELQAAILRVKMRHIDAWNDQRRRHAGFYREHLRDLVAVPVEKAYEHSVYQTFVIQARRRDALRAFLEAQGIETKIHYPIPIHLQEASHYLGYRKGDFPVTEIQSERILSLPIYPELSQAQLNDITTAIRTFFKA